MKKIKYLSSALIAASALSLTSFAAMAADFDVTDAYFKQGDNIVHTLSDGSLECVINTSNADENALMINAVYEKNTNKLLRVQYAKAVNGEFKNTIDVTDAGNTYITMCIWDGIVSANAKTQVYSIASSDSAPENPWNVKVNNKGAVSFEWGASEDNLKTAGYRIYKNGVKIGDTDATRFADTEAKWYENKIAEYKLTSYDEFGNESDGKILKDVAIDNSDIAAVLFSQPNITEKMSLYFATGKDQDNSWYGYNVADTVEGVECRRIPPDRRAVFKLSGDFKSRMGSAGIDAVIRITYFDNDTDYFKVSYVGTGSRYTDIEIHKTGTNEWITKELPVSDLASVYMDPSQGARVQDESVDFTIWSKSGSDKGDVVDTDTYISELQLILTGEISAPPTSEPTLAPGETPAPAPTEAPTPTPIPTINPADITKASIKLLDGNTADTSAESEYNLMSIFWGKNNGQINSTGWYGYTTGTEIDGVKCREIVDNKRIVLMYDDALNMAIGNQAREAVIRVRYYDSGSDKIRVSYIGDKARYTTVAIQKTDTGTWKWADIPVKDLINKANDGHETGLQDEQTYFSIWSRASGENEGNNTPDYISEIELILDKNAAEPTSEPSVTSTPNATSEPGTTSTPKPTEMPTPTSSPAAIISPADITKASIKLLDGATAAASFESEYNLMSVFWGANDGQIDKSGWYAYTTGAEKDGVKCREIADNKRIVLMYSDTLNKAIGDKAREATIRVKYYDSGSDRIRVSYIGDKARYTTVNIQKTNGNGRIFR